MKTHALAIMMFSISFMAGCSGGKYEDSSRYTEGENIIIGINKFLKKIFSSDSKIICDEFNLLARLEGASLVVSIDTDLPDETVVMVGVSRSYQVKDNGSTYAVYYFSEKSTISKWKSKHSISVDSKAWEKVLRAKQEEMSRLGFDIDFISDKIKVRVVVPINQADSRFGDWNQNLIGKSVKDDVIRIVENEVVIDYPLSTYRVESFSFPSIAPRKLEMGQFYIVSKQTPLMSSYRPTDPIADVQQIKHIPQGGGFRVIEVYRKELSPWYRVVAYDQSREQLGTGWINSVALLGQELKIPE